MRLKPRVWRGLMITTAMLMIAVALPLSWYQWSVQPGAAIVRVAFESGAAVQAGPGFSLDPPDVTVERVAIAAADVPAAHLDIYAPTDSTMHPIVLWIHGGGFIANSSADIAGYARVLASRGYLVAALDYSLAPGARYPTPVVQANAALGWLTAHAAQHGGDPATVFVGGDSAGAQIASELAAVETDPAFATQVGVTPQLTAGQLRGVVLFCGLYDMQTVAGTGFPALRTFLWSYTGYRDWLAFPRIDELSTTKAATSAYPPAFIAVGDADPFASQASELAARLTALGDEVTTEFWTDHDLGHEYQFDFRLPEARQTLDDTLTFLEDHAS